MATNHELLSGLTSLRQDILRQQRGLVAKAVGSEPNIDAQRYLVVYDEPVGKKPAIYHDAICTYVRKDAAEAILAGGKTEIKQFTSHLGERKQDKVQWIGTEDEHHPDNTRKLAVSATWKTARNLGIAALSAIVPGAGILVAGAGLAVGGATGLAALMQGNVTDPLTGVVVPGLNGLQRGMVNGGANWSALSQDLGHGISSMLGQNEITVQELINNSKSAVDGFRGLLGNSLNGLTDVQRSYIESAIQAHDSGLSTLGNLPHTAELLFSAPAVTLTAFSQYIFPVLGRERRIGEGSRMAEAMIQPGTVAEPRAAHDMANFLEQSSRTKGNFVAHAGNAIAGKLAALASGEESAKAAEKLFSHWTELEATRAEAISKLQETPQR